MTSPAKQQQLKAEDFAQPWVESEGSDSNRKPNQVTQALEMVVESGAETWKDEAGVPHLTVRVEGHVEHYRLSNSSESLAGRWLSQSFYGQKKRALSASIKKDVLENLIAEAMASERVWTSGRRVARKFGNVYLDLCSPLWEMVEVTQEGWRIRPASEIPVRFTRAANMLPLPHPLPGGSVDDLRPFFHCEREDFQLILAWIIVALSGGREYPVLVFGGEPGSAKSTATRYARALVDPNAAPLRKCPREERDLFIAAKNAFVLTVDNLSSAPDWLSDALCALALDTGYACRALYTNEDEAVFRVAAPIILNGISEQLTRSDLADRSLSVTLHRIDPKIMRPKDELDASFEAVIPKVLGALLGVLAAALRRLPEIHLERLPRMAQTAKFMAAAEPALGWKAGTFAILFQRAQESAADRVVEGDPLAQAFQELVRRGGGRWSFVGSATDLRKILEGVRPNPMPPVWPPAVAALGTRVRRLGNQLRHLGWEINPDGRDGTHKNGRCIRLASPDLLAFRPSFIPFLEEENDPPALSACPKANNDGDRQSDSSKKRLSAPSANGLEMPLSSDSPWLPTADANQMPAPPTPESLSFGQADGADGSNPGLLYEGEIA